MMNHPAFGRVALTSKSRQQHLHAETEAGARRAWLGFGRADCCFRQRLPAIPPERDRLTPVRLWVTRPLGASFADMVGNPGAPGARTSPHQRLASRRYYDRVAFATPSVLTVDEVKGHHP